jgi:hypothetical protein
MLQTRPSSPSNDMPEAARAAILRAIDSSPAARFESAAAMLEAISH